MIRLDSQDKISGGLEESCMCTCRTRSADVGKAKNGRLGDIVRVGSGRVESSLGQALFFWPAVPSRREVKVLSLMSV